MFRDGVGDPEIEPVHREVARASKAVFMQFFHAEPGADKVAAPGDAAGVEMIWIVLRGVLQGLAAWWSDHPDVPRERVLAIAMISLWLGLERAYRGEDWAPAGQG